MPLITASHDSLPYIDPPPPPTGPHSLTAATALINALLPPSHTQTPHPSLPPLRPTTTTRTPLAESEHARIAAKTPLTGIDLERYELDSPPLPSASSTSASTTDEADKGEKGDMKTTLQKTHTASTYLHARAQHLALLDTYGKNAWLVGNARLEDLLKGLEAEVVGVRGEVEGVNVERRRGQERAKGEMEGLEAGWREGIGRVLRVEVAGGEVEGRLREGLRGGER